MTNTNFALNKTIVHSLYTVHDECVINVSTHRARELGDALDAPNAFRWTGNIYVRNNVIDMRALQAAFSMWWYNAPMSSTHSAWIIALQTEVMHVIHETIERRDASV